MGPHMSKPIDFAAARARVLKLVPDRSFFVDVEFSPQELAPPVRPTVADLLRDCVEEVGARGVRQELSK